MAEGAPWRKNRRRETPSTGWFGGGGGTKLGTAGFDPAPDSMCGSGIGPAGPRVPERHYLIFKKKQKNELEYRKEHRLGFLFLLF